MHHHLGREEEEDDEQDFFVQLLELQERTVFAVDHQAHQGRSKAAPTQNEGKQLFLQGYQKPSHVLSSLHVHAPQVRGLPLPHHCLQRLRGGTQEKQPSQRQQRQKLWRKSVQLHSLVPKMLPRRPLLPHNALDAARLEKVSGLQLQVQVLTLILPHFIVPLAVRNCS